MTDKEVIVDGVNVSRCEQHCSDNHNNPNMCYQDMTGGYLNCQPKERQCNFYITQIEQQLARKTEECERAITRIKDLEERIMKHSDNIEHYCERLANKEQQLQAEQQKVKELEEKLFQIEDIVKPINEGLPEDNVIRKIMLILNDCPTQRNIYREVLEEIRQELEEATHCESQECGCDDAEACLECTKKLILQKCEVLND